MMYRSGGLRIAFAMDYFPFWLAALDINFAHDGESFRRDVRRVVSENVLVPCLFGDPAECVFHGPCRQSAESISARGRCEGTQHAEAAFEGAAIFGDGIELNVIEQEQSGYFIERVSGLPGDLSVGNDENDFPA